MSNRFRTLHFTLGPVQGFVAQARRTRDFWAGSFLLSYLAGEAMACVLEHGGTLVLPAAVDAQRRVSDPFLEAILRKREGRPVKDGPSLATLPNRFQTQVPEEFDPGRCAEEVRRAWETLAAAVWERYLAPVAALGKNAQVIWHRQVAGFWEIAWVLGEDPALLDRRKNWRSYVPPVEPGDKCTLMGNWQEISGYARSKERERQEEFWAALRQRVGGHELEPEERLCAVALIKRLLPLVAEEVLWPLPARYPSTPFVAAVPWVRSVIRSQPEVARRFATRAVRLGGYKEDPERIPGLRTELERQPMAREFAALDANCFFDAALANPRLWEEPESSEPLRKELRQALRNLGTSPSSFYGLLLMDGDRLGQLLREYGHRKVSEALTRFSGRVQEIVGDHDGVTVYAGGDDVLAFLPLEGALPAAVALRRAYQDAFLKTGPDAEIPATISGAIVYAHYNLPLTHVAREAHRLLDEVAKEETGRDSLAITVWKGAGPVLAWAAPWEIVLEGDGHVFDRLVQQFSGEDVSEDNASGGSARRAREFSAAFFYKLHEYLSWLGSQENGPQTGEDEEQLLATLVDVLAAHYLKTRDIKVGPEEARRRVRSLLRVCLKYHREPNGSIRREVTSAKPDGALLVKFLAQKGVGA
jgi:CRISPR-associated protein Cmr2